MLTNLEVLGIIKQELGRRKISVREFRGINIRLKAIKRRLKNLHSLEFSNIENRVLTLEDQL